MYNNQQIVCITGADGSGKSTLTAGLHQALGGPVYISHIWDALEQQPGLLFRSKKDIDIYLCGLSPNSRLLFLAHALQYSIDRAVTSGTPLVLVNAYYYKYFATELALGASETLANHLAANFPAPHRLLRLVITPETAATRKPFFSRYECGLAEEPGPGAFIAFQHKAAAFWQNFDQTNFHDLDAEQSPELILQQALNHIQHP